MLPVDTLYDDKRFLTTSTNWWGQEPWRNLNVRFPCTLALFDVATNSGMITAVESRSFWWVVVGSGAYGGHSPVHLCGRMVTVLAWSDSWRTRVWILVRSSVNSTYVIGLISWVDMGWFRLFMLKVPLNTNQPPSWAHRRPQQHGHNAGYNWSRIVLCKYFTQLDICRCIL